MNRVFAFVIVMGCTLPASPAWAAPETDQLLPATTKGYLSVPDVTDFRQRWQQMQLGKLAADPIMKPFAEDLQRQLREQVIQDSFHVSLDWNDLVTICSGELCLATIQPEGDEKQHASVMIVDVHGRVAETERLLQGAAGELETQGAKRTIKNVAGHNLVIFDLPRKRGELLADRVVRFLVNETLVFGDNEEVCVEILQRLLSGSDAPALNSVTAFQRIMQRVEAQSGPAKPQVRWYLDPVGYAETIRAARGGPRKRRKDMLAILKVQGFEAIEAVGGWIHLATGEQELLHRTFVYAPGRPAGEERFELAARMLDFPNDEVWKWPSWVPRELASATSFRWNVPTAFEYSKTLVDAIAGDEDFFEDLLASIRDDPNGPQIDVRSDFVAHLGHRLTVVSDHVFPITPQSERAMVAIEVTNEEAVRQTVHKALVSDPDARQLEIEGVTVWEIIDQGHESGPDLDLSIDGIDPIGDQPAEVVDEEERILRNSAIAVARGHFIVATHVDFLRRILVERADDDQLSACEDFEMVKAHLDRIGASADCLRTFSRTDEAYRPTFELLRQGKMPESESLLGRLLNRILGPDEKDVLRKQSIDGRRLPDFQAVRRYLGPTGNFMRTEEDGWYVGGVLLDKHALYVDQTPTPIASSAPVDAHEAGALPDLNAAR